jgi:hypothetical protein
VWTGEPAGGGPGSSRQCAGRNLSHEFSHKFSHMALNLGFKRSRFLEMISADSQSIMHIAATAACASLQRVCI